MKKGITKVKLDNAYSCLGLSSSAHPRDVKKAYRQLMSKYHPDVNATQEAKIRSRQINEAHDLIEGVERGVFFVLKNTYVPIQNPKPKKYGESQYTEAEIKTARKKYKRKRKEEEKEPYSQSEVFWITISCFFFGVILFLIACISLVGVFDAKNTGEAFFLFAVSASFFFQLVKMIKWYNKTMKAGNKK